MDSKTICKKTPGFPLRRVLWNYIVCGVNCIPTEESFAALDARSSGLRKLHGSL